MKKLKEKSDSKKGKNEPLPESKPEPESPAFDQVKDPILKFLDGDIGEPHYSPPVTPRAKKINNERNDFTKFEKFYEATLAELNKKDKPFRPESDLHEYLKVPQTYNLFSRIISEMVPLEKREEPSLVPLFVLNLIFAQMQFIELHKDRPVELIHHFTMFKIHIEPFFHFLMRESLQYLLSRESAKLSSEKDEQLLAVIEIIQTEFKLDLNIVLKHTIESFNEYMGRFNEIGPNLDLLEKVSFAVDFDFEGSGNFGDIEMVRIKLKRIPLPDHKINYLQNCIKFFRQCAPDSFEVIHSKKNPVPFVDLCKAEIEYLEDIIEKKNQKKTLKLGNSSKEVELKPKVSKPHFNTVKKEKRVKEVLRIANKLILISNEKLSVNSFAFFIKNEYDKLNNGDSIEEGTIRDYFYTADPLIKFKDDHKDKFRS